MSKTALIIVAHPDDEVVGVGGTILKLQREYGYTVHVQVMSYAPHEKKWDYFRKSSKILGFTTGFPIFTHTPNKLDEGCINTLVGYITNILNVLQPEVVFTHHLGDLHQDHRAVGEAVLIATRPYPNQVVKKLYTFETAHTSEWNFGEFSKFEPNVYLDISDYYKTKKEALDIYKEEISLLEPEHPRSLAGVENSDLYRGFSVGLEKVESFKLVRSIDML